MERPPKIIAIVMNIIVVAICAVAIAAYFFKPLLGFSAKITFTPELTDVIKNNLPEDSGSTAEGEISEREIMEEVLTQIGKDNITVNASVNIQTIDVLASLSASEQETKNEISKIIETNVNEILDDVSGSIDKVVESLSKSMVKVSVKSTLKTEIEKQEIKDDDGNVMTVDEVLTDLGLNDEYLDTTTEKLLDAMKDENATTESIANEAVNVVNEVLAKVSENANADDAKEVYKKLDLPASLDETKEQEVKDAVTKILNDYADENGNVNLDDVLYSLIGQALDKQNGGTESGDETANAEIADEETLVTLSVDGETTVISDGSSDATKKKYTKEEVRQMLHDRIMENVSDDALSGITVALKVISGIILFTLAIWAWLVFKIIIKLFMRNPMIKLWPPIWFGNLLFPILYAVPVALAFAFSNLASLPTSVAAQLQSALGESAYSAFMSVGNAISLEATSCTIITLVMTIVLIIYSIIYWIVRNKYKRAL